MNIKILRVYLNPILIWNDNFEYARKKIIDSVIKLIKMQINGLQVFIYFNTYMLKIYFLVIN